MDLKRLEIFCRVIELKSFTRAAEATRLSQPTISEHVRHLEEVAGEKLLDRLGREARPTQAGQILYRYALRMLRLRDEALQTITQTRGQLSGHLVLGASTIPGTYILPEVIARFKRDLPDVRMSLQIANTVQIVRRLLDGEIELGIIGAQSRDARLSCEPLFADELILVAAPGHPWAALESVTLNELASLPLLWREADSGTRISTEQYLQTHGIDPARLDIVAEIGSAEAIRQAAKAGIGAAILSSRSVQEDLYRQTLVRLPLRALQIARSFYLISRKNRQISPLASAFRNDLRQAAALPCSQL